MAPTSKKNSLAEDDTMTLPGALSRDERRLAAEGRLIRKINPLGMRVVVRLKPEENRTDAGLYLPEGTKQAMSDSLLAEVVEVASAHDDESEQDTNISGVPLHSLVLIPQKAGVRVPWDDDLRIVDTKEILALVEEIALS